MRKIVANADARQVGTKVFVCYLQHSNPRGVGWYWWIEGADDFMTGPFNGEADAHADIHRASQEADGR